jgi:hypothetical protein
MEVRLLFVSGELAGLVSWCSSIAIETEAYIVVEGEFLAEFPNNITCNTKWPFHHNSHYYA